MFSPYTLDSLVNVFRRYSFVKAQKSYTCDDFRYYVQVEIFITLQKVWRPFYNYYIRVYFLYAEEFSILTLAVSVNGALPNFLHVTELYGYLVITLCDCLIDFRPLHYTAYRDESIKRASATVYFSSRYFF